MHLKLFAKQGSEAAPQEGTRKGPPCCQNSGTKGTNSKAEAVRERDRARRASQSVEQQQVRLHKKNATEHKRQAAETPDHREARLEGRRAAQQERLQLRLLRRDQTGESESSSSGLIFNQPGCNLVKKEHPGLSLVW